MAVHNRKEQNPSGPISNEFWSGPDLKELARMQHVRPAERLEALLGGWPAEEVSDGFEDALARWRQEPGLE